MAEKLAEIRLGPTESPKDLQLALQEVAAKLNELIREHNKLVEEAVTS